MSKTSTQTNPADTNSNTAEIEHIFCDCDPDIALCSTDISGEEDIGAWDEYSENMCIVCVDLYENQIPCVRCGE